MNIQLIREFCSTVVDVIDHRDQLLDEVVRLRKENKEYKRLIYNDVQRPHPAEAMLTLMLEGNMTLHPKEKKE